MKPTFILDTCFIDWLSLLDVASKKWFDPPLAPDKRPFASLDFLQQKGCNLVIPNEVLKEIFIDRDSAGKMKDRMGMGCTSGGNAYIGESLFERNGFIPKFAVYLQRKLQEGGVHYFATPEEYTDYFRDDKSKEGSISLVAAFPLIPGSNGIESQGPHDSLGDDEIMLLAAKMKKESQHIPVVTISGDKEIGTRQNNNRLFHLSTGKYLQLLNVAGFLDDRFLTPQIFTASSKLLNSHREDLTSAEAGPRARFKIESIAKSLGLASGRAMV